ncbi:unnamed protein product [Spirodela intermedia]|uniref:DUF1421 domain-containing protein n=1 Tax=Spirodela intermedia TaxID=51605 RepID=A0A7I8JSJ5_SPIIN|nr:unnamed protein product [Spirodela intermedia]CAA6673094.1 unnamed protein product [Spirodela intermedia]
MNASQFMDKQIMELSASGAQSSDLLDLLNPPEKHRSNGAGSGDGGKKDDILPNYDFQPIRNVGSSPPPATVEGGRAWGSMDSIPTSSNFRERNYSSSEAHDSYNVIHEKSKDACDTALLIEFDRTVKKYADNLMHALEGVSSRLSQLEGRTHKLESALDDLKLTISNNNGSSDGKLKQLENIMREVFSFLILRALFVMHLDASISTSCLPCAPTAATTSGAPDPVSFCSGHAPTGALLRSTQSASGRGPTAAVPACTSASTSASPPTQFQPTPHPPQYSQPPQSSQHIPPPQLQAPPPHHPEESSPYMPPPPQTYPPSIRQPPQLSGPPPTQQFAGHGANLFDPQAIKPSSAQQFPTGYSPSAGPGLSDSYTHGGSPSHYNSAMKQPPFFSSAAASGGSSYPRLPTAQVLPQAVSAGSGSASGSGPGPGSAAGERVPIDDVVDKVTTMGFPRDMVRATVRRLTENGQNVDLNVVLDKLMNDGENPPQKGWFGR